MKRMFLKGHSLEFWAKVEELGDSEGGEEASSQPEGRLAGRLGAGPASAPPAPGPQPLTALLSGRSPDS